jgi:glycerol-3-phosphate dehydrogenase
VFESLRERAWLLRTRPHLVRPQRFLLPLVEWARRPAWQLRAGLAAYDVLSLRGGLPRHRAVDARAARQMAPSIATLAGGLLFSDARAVSPERLALELALEARAMGAALFNHCAVTGIEAAGGRVNAVRVAAGEGETTIGARAVINAAGPWVDAVNALTGRPGVALLGVTKGTHVALDAPGHGLRAAVISTAKSDGRVFFAIPRDGLLLVGTTDDRFDGAADSARPAQAEIAYLLSEAKTLLPGASIGPEQVRYAYAGLRPLQRTDDGAEAAISRRHSVIDHGSSGGPRGLLSVVGGKLSTFRPLAREVARAIDAPGSVRAEARPPVVAEGRLRQYGAAAPAIAKLGPGVVCEHAGALVAEVMHAVREEQAVTLSDVILRRTGIGWGATRGLCCAGAIAEVAGRELGWSAAQRTAQLAAFEREVRRHLPSLEELET